MRVLAAVIFFASALSALAEGTTAPASMGAPKGLLECKADREKFCAKFQPGSPEVFQCMKEHADQLSDGCKAARAKLPGSKGSNTNLKKVPVSNTAEIPAAAPAPAPAPTPAPAPAKKAEAPSGGGGW